MIDLEDINRSLEKFSLVGGQSEPDSYDSFRDVLLRLAGQFRRDKKAYEINFKPSSGSDYRLRSNKEFDGPVVEKQIKFHPYKSTLEVTVEGLSSEQLEALERELKVLIAATKEKDSDPEIEPELNLLRKRAFLAELQVEYQRWERYEKPLTLIVCRLEAGGLDGADVGREFKHLAKMTDIVGYISEEKLAGIFPGQTGGSKTVEKISRRLENRFGEKISLNSTCVPGDTEQFSSLEEQIKG